MIRVNKGSAPQILTDEGTHFQDNAVLFAHAEDYDNKYKAAFEEHGEFDTDTWDFLGFNSALFSKYAHYKDPSVKRQLINEQFGKCVFCEMFIMHGDAGDVEHFRPKSAVSIADHEVPSERSVVRTHPGYYWLSQTWTNLFLSCRQCNGAYKGTLFDVQNESQRDKPGENNEVPALLYPCDPALDPRDVLHFDPETARAIAVVGGAGNPYVNQARAEATIKITGLNRPRLLEARSAHLVKLRALFVLAANGGGAQLQDGPPDILKFVFDRECAGLDAVKALNHAVTAVAEFSGLAIDAIAKWNTELTLQNQPVDLANVQVNTIRVNTRLLRLIEQHDLECRYKQQNANAADIEVQPDTSSIDRDYNDLLVRYKKLVQKIAGKVARITKAQQKVAVISGQLQQLHQQATDDEKVISDIDLAWESHQDFVEYDRYVQSAPLQQKALWSTYDLRQQNRLKFIDQMPLDERNKAFAHLAWVPDPNTALRYQQAKSRLQTIDDQRMPLIAKEERLASRLNAYDDQLAELHLEVSGILGAYQHAGADATRRKARCHALFDAIGQLRDWLLDINTHLEPINYTNVTPFTIRDHLDNKKWPARIMGA